MSAPLLLRRASVPPEWIDYNAHMMDGYYAVAFSSGIDAFMDQTGLDAAYRAQTHGTLYTAEMHIVYLRELKTGVPFRLSGQLLDYDARRIHLFLELCHDTQAFTAATAEAMLLHVNQDLGRVVPMPEPIVTRLAELSAVHAPLPVPTQVGRKISLTR
jgi:acyl-CoA thioester hydrolase